MQPLVLIEPNSDIAPVDIRFIVGPVFLGALFTWLLFGTLVAQYYFYQVSFRGDSKFIRYTLMVLMLLETLQTIAATEYTWRIAVSGWGQQDTLAKTSWSVASIPIISGLVAGLVQVFFAWRIHKLGRWRVVSAAVVLLALLQCGSGMAVGIKFALLGNFSKIVIVYPIVATWLVSSATCDVLIACAMVYFLTRARTLLGENDIGSGPMLGRLVRMSIETGLATATFALLDLGLEFGFKNTNMHLLPCIMLTKMYSNSLLASLNARSPAFSGRGEVIVSGRSTNRDSSFSHVVRFKPNTESMLTVPRMFEMQSQQIEAEQSSTNLTGTVHTCVDEEK